MIFLKRIEVYREIWVYFNLKYTVGQIGETIETIERTKIYPNTDEDSYEIWQKYLEVVKKFEDKA